MKTRRWLGAVTRFRRPCPHGESLMAFDRERDTSTGRGLAVQTTHNGRRVVTLEQLFVRVRRRENRFYDAIYRIVKACQRFRIPVIRPLHRALYYERRAR